MICQDTDGLGPDDIPYPAEGALYDGNAYIVTLMPSQHIFYFSMIITGSISRRDLRYTGRHDGPEFSFYKHPYSETHELYRSIARGFNVNLNYLVIGEGPVFRDNKGMIDMNSDTLRHWGQKKSRGSFQKDQLPRPGS